MAAKRTPKTKAEVTHIDITMADTGTATGVDAVAKIDASLTVADTATVTGIDRARVTWRDWLPPEAPEPDLNDLITREELLDEIRAVPMRMSESTLRLRESQGILPRPWRRWRDGATRALYPTWMPELVIYTDILLDSRLGNPTDDLSTVAAKAREYVPGVLERATRWRSTAMTEDIPAALARVADLFQDTEKRPTQASITLRDADGGLVATFNGIQIPGT